MSKPKSFDRRLGLACGSFCAAASLFSSAAVAQSAPEADANADELETVVVTGYVDTQTSAGVKGSAPLVEIPQSISVISRDRMDLMGLDKVEQAVRYVSGVIGEGFGPDERGSSLRVRAFTPDQFVDGVRSPLTSARNTNVDLFLVERVEILKGPVSSLYGQAPAGGVYMLSLRRPEEEFSAQGRFTLGTQDHVQAGATVTGPLNADATITGRVTATGYDRNHMVDNAYAKRWAASAAINFQLTPRTDLLFTGFYQDDEIRGSLQFLPYSGTVAPNPNGVIPRNRMSGEPYGGNFNNQFDAGYTLTHEFSDALSLTHVLRYGERQEATISVFGAAYATGSNRRINRTAFDQDLRPHRLAVDTRLDWTFETGPIQHSTVFGVDIYDFDYMFETGSLARPNDLDVFDPVYPGAAAIVRPVMTNQQHWDQLRTGYYGQDRIRIGDLFVTAGARYDVIDGTNRNRITDVVVDEDNDAWSYRLGLNYLFDNGIAPYLGYSRSFEPVFGVAFDGSAFTPSYTDQYEVGIKYDVVALPGNGRLFLSVAAYQYDISGLVTGDLVNPGFSVQTGATRMQGFELEGVARLVNGLSINGAFTYSDPRVRRSNTASLVGKRITATPEYLASLFVDYTFQQGAFEGFGFGGGVRYVSEKFGDAQNVFPVPEVTLVDAMLSYTTDEWSSYLNASNLLDEDYVAVCTSASGCSYGNERVVTFSFARRF